MVKKKEEATTTQDLVEVGNQIVKKKRGGKTASVKHNMTAKGEDIKRIGKSLLRWYKMPKAVTDEEIAKRLELYFTTTLMEGQIPTVEEMALALGYDRKTLWAWETGGEGSTPTRRNLIKKAKELIASFDAEMVQEGKLNPVTYIFRAKNYFGLTDKQEYILTPNNPLGEVKDSAEIRQRLSEGVTED